MNIRLFSLGASCAAWLALIVLLCLSAGCESDDNGPAGSMADSADSSAELSSPVNDDPIASDRVVMVVYGMSCPLCATNVDKQLLSVDGVSSVHVDLSTGRIDVSLAPSPKPSTRQLADAVMRSGFTLKSIESGSSREGAATP